MLPTPAPGFDDPLAMLTACHDRILKQCSTLEKLSTHLRRSGLTPDARAAATEVHRYFSTAGMLHHQDEEQDLFPLLRADSALASLIDGLAAEHRRMEVLWRQLEPQLARPETIIEDLDGFAALVSEFSQLYAGHVAREDRELLPRAREWLPAEVQSVIGARMAARRGITA